MRLNLEATFDSLYDEEVHKENGVEMTVKRLVIHALNDGVSLRMPMGQAGGCDQNTRLERGELYRRIKRAKDSINITRAEAEIIQEASHDALIPAFLHAQLVEIICPEELKVEDKKE